MRIVLFALSVALLVGCSTDPLSKLPNATEEEKAAAAAAWRECLYSQVPKYDDGISPANVVGGSMGGACQREYEFFRREVLRGDCLTTMCHIAFEQAEIEGKARVQTAEVLKYRADQRSRIK